MKSDLLNVLQSHFSTPEKLKTLKAMKHFHTGFERWFEVEILSALYDIGFTEGCEIKIFGKIAKDCDLIILGEGIELKAHHSVSPRNEMIIGFSQHPNADSYLFLAENDERVAEVRDAVSNLEERDLGGGWTLIYVRREEVE